MKLIHLLKLVFLLIAINSTFSQSLKDEEKIFFNKFEKDSIHFDLIKGLSLIDSLYSDKTLNHNKITLTNFIKTLPEKQKSDKKEKRRVKKIYNLIHEKFFKKYDIEVFFNDVFTSKKYNYVTATALYVLKPEVIDNLYLRVGKFYYGSNKFTKAKIIFERV